MEEAKVFLMSFTKVYGLLVSKAQKKGRTKARKEALISCDFNRHKFYLRSQVKQLAA